MTSHNPPCDRVSSPVTTGVQVTAADSPERTTPLLAAADVAVILGKSKTWVHEQARAGRIAHHRVGRTLRFTQQDVRDYLATVRRGTAGENPWGLTPRATSRRRRAS